MASQEAYVKRVIEIFNLRPDDLDTSPNIFCEVFRVCQFTTTTTTRTRTTTTTTLSTTEIIENTTTLPEIHDTNDIYLNAQSYAEYDLEKNIFKLEIFLILGQKLYM